MERFEVLLDASPRLHSATNRKQMQEEQQRQSRARNRELLERNADELLPVAIAAVLVPLSSFER
jgi:hypothetical protein